MTRLPPLFRWLVLAALGDWLIARTLSRTAIFMPKSPVVIQAYQALMVAGSLASTLSALLGILALGWLAWRYWRWRNVWGVAGLLLGLLALNTLFLFVPAAGGAAVAFHVLALATLGALVWDARAAMATTGERLAAALPILAIALGEAYQLSQAWVAAQRLPGPAPLAIPLFNLGEVFAVLSPVGLWWVSHRGTGSEGEGRLYAWAAVPALGFAAMQLANPAMTGILTVWSTGLTLFLPWPIYPASLWLAGVVVFRSRRMGDARGWALLMLMAGGYAPQMSSQLFLGLIALWLLLPPPAHRLLPLRQAPRLNEFGQAPAPSKTS